MRHRSYLDIIAVILNATNDRRGIGKSRLMHKTFLGYALLKEYLQVLTEMGLLHYDRDAQTFKTSQKGLRFLNS